MFKTLRRAAALTMAAACAVLVSCGAKASLPVKADGKYAAIKKSGRLVVGTSADYPPFEFHKQEKGKDVIIGADIDLAEKIAGKMGVKLKIKDMDFSKLVPALNSGSVDIVISGMVDTRERAGTVDFSKPYYYSGDLAVVLRGNKTKYTALSEITGKVGAVAGTEQETLVKKTVPSDRFCTENDAGALINDLKNKKITAAVLEKSIADGYIKGDKALSASNVKFVPAKTGPAVAVKKNGGKSLLAILDSVTSEERNSGSFENLLIKYTGIAEK